MSYEYNIFFIGAEGFREHIKSIAENAQVLADSRNAIVSVLTEMGATPDNYNKRVGGDRPPVGGSNGVMTGPSKLDKYAPQGNVPQGELAFVPSTAPETKEETINKLAQSGFLAKDQVDEVAAAFADTTKTPGAGYPRSSRSDIAATVNAADTDILNNILKPSKLLKYAKAERKD